MWVEILKLNPLGYVPVLVDGDFVVSDSFAILMYLDEKYPQHPLLPRDLHKKAINYQKFIEEKVSPDEKLPWVQYHIRNGFAGTLHVINYRSNIGGSPSEYTCKADLFLAAQLHPAIKRFNVDMTPFPLLSRLHEAYNELPAFQNGNKGIEKGDFDGFALDMSTEEEEEEEEDGEEVEEDEDDGELEEQDNDNSVGRIEADVAADGSGVRFYQQFDHVEYEALAAKKRKGLGDCEGLVLLKKRGRRKGSKNKLSPKITKMLGDATVLYAHGRYEEAISVLNEVVRLAPHVPDSYHTLGLVHIALGNTEKAMGFYTIAARLMPKDSPLWRVLFDWHK
ncbi:hypothetical protein GH714_019237 [Hevea brasiliensis]|uniref:GST N-terminal domain-containing protein n=1 Tax=Hevea brasiliensis TaxID=3981 RepID=A0A6A6MTY9_HEVBR|nr:hypothetical protein GH714_019237 [Hevea brasiliensis]